MSRELIVFPRPTPRHRSAAKPSGGLRRGRELGPLAQSWLFSLALGVRSVDGTLLGSRQVSLESFVPEFEAEPVVGVAFGQIVCHDTTKSEGVADRRRV
jgi:hypothetical protein